MFLNAKHHPGQPADHDGAAAMSSTHPQGRTRSSWRWALGAFFFALVGVLLFFSQTGVELARTWLGNSTYSHGILIFPISAFLLWQARDSLSQVPPSSDWFGAVLFAGFVFVWLIGDAASVQLLQQAALVGMVQSLFWAIFGFRVVRRAWFPLAFLVFAIPVGDFLVGPLQYVTAEISVHLLRAAGIPIFQDALFISIPGASFFVAEACSGLRFSISTLVLGILVARYFVDGGWRRAAVLALALLIPVLANAARVFLIIAAAHFGDGTSDDHISTGWGFFAVVTLAYLAACLLFRSSAGRGHGLETPAAATPTALAAAKPKKFAIVGALVLLLAAGGSAYSAVSLPAATDGEINEIVEAIQVSGEWSRRSDHVSGWQPAFPSADYRRVQTFEKNGNQVDLFIGYFSFQRQGAEVIQYANRFDDDQVWRKLGGGKTSATIEDERLTLGADRLTASGTKRLVWYWYWVDGRFTADPYVAKLLQVKARLSNGPQAAAAVAVSTTYQAQSETAAQILKDFLGNVDSFEEPLRSARPMSTAAKGLH